MSFPFFVQDESCSASKASCAFSSCLGKRQGRESAVTPGKSPVISALSSVSSQEGALSVFCHRQKRAFLVDSGADMSVFPVSPAQMKSFSPPQSSVLSLRAANGTSIRTFGKKSVSLSFPGLKLVHRFLLAGLARISTSTGALRASGARKRRRP